MSNESKVCDCNQGRMPCTCKTAEPGAGYTAVDMTTAAAQGFRDGVASVVVELPEHFEFDNPGEAIEVLKRCREAILAAGGRIKE